MTQPMQALPKQVPTTSVFHTHVLTLAVTMCAWLERAGIPAGFCEARCHESKYEVSVPANLAWEAREALAGWR